MVSAALSMGDPPAIELVSPALAGGLLATVFPGKSSEYLYTKSLHCVCVTGGYVNEHKREQLI